MTRRKEDTRAPNGASSVYLGADSGWHGRVTVGVRDDGKPDRRHVRGATESEIVKKVRKLERERDTGKVRRAGRAETLGQWLAHWVENVAARTVRPKTLAGYRTAVNYHLIPGLGPHRLDKLLPDHIERLYTRMLATGLAPATVHQVHRTLRTALNEAVRRSRITGTRRRLPRVRGVPQRVVMDLMGWSHTAMTVRYQHVSGQARPDIAAQLGGLLWDRNETGTETR